MRVFLVEKKIGKRLEPISIKSNFEIAMGLINSGDAGLITEMVIDEVYPEGIGVCNHWHFGEEEKEERAGRNQDDKETKEEKRK